MAKQKFNFQFGTPQPSQTTNDTANQSDVNTVAAIVQRLENNEKNPFEIKLVPRTRIRMNRKNTYPVEEIDSLAKSILEFGLQQNLVVIYSTEEDIYIIETGHRRATALNMLIDKYSKSEDTSSPEYALYLKNVAPYKKGFPCRVIYLDDGIKYDIENTDLSTVPVSVIDSEIRLYITNEEIRAKNPARTAQAVARLRQLYAAKNATLVQSDKINVNNEIAQNLNISPRQVAKYNATDNLIPELQTLFNDNNITLTNAAAYAQLSPADQQQIYQIFKMHDDMNAKQLNELIKNNNELSQQIKTKEAEIDSLSSQHPSSNDNAELLRLKQQIADLKSQKTAILTENSDLKQQILANRNFKTACDNLVAAATRFIYAAEQYSKDVNCNKDNLKKALTLSSELSSLDFF